MHQGAANGGVAVGGDAHANAGAADEYTEINAHLRHSIANSMREIRIIDTGLAIRAEIHDLMAGLDQRHGKTVFQGNAAMVGAQGNE
jgi:hypothetical protein